MGTRSLTHVIDGQTTILTLYRQLDGYPEGHGVDLARACKVRVVNGIGMDDAYATAANGVGCLAARIVRELKTGIGGVYVEPPGASDCGEDYVYTVEADRKGQPVISCHSFDGTPVFSRRTPASILRRFAKSAA